MSQLEALVRNWSISRDKLYPLTSNMDNLWSNVEKMHLKKIMKSNDHG